MINLKILCLPHWTMSTCSLPWQMATWRLLLWGLEAAASKDHDGRSQKTMGKIGTKSGIAKSKLYKSQLIFYCRSRKNDTPTCQFGSYFSHKSTEYLCFVMYMAYFGENMVFSRETFSRKDNERLHEHMHRMSIYGSNANLLPQIFLMTRIPLLFLPIGFCNEKKHTYYAKKC